MPKGKIPEDFPHAAVLAAADINTFSQLAKFSKDYTEITGIGPAFALDVAAGVEALDNPEAPIMIGIDPAVPGEDRTVEQVVEVGKPCLFQSDPQTIRQATAFGIDPETGVAGRLHVVTDRFHEYFNVRRSSEPLRVGSPNGVGCYYVEEPSGDASD